MTPKRVGPAPWEKALARRCLLYGITPEQYKKMLLLQRGFCAICGRPPKKKSLNIDHDHTTQRVRGLLCFQCNHKILTRGVDAIRLRAAADYLDRDFDARKL